MKPDTHFWINDNDKDLKPIRIDIAKVIEKNYLFWNPSHEGPIPILEPDFHKIRNATKKKEDQVWVREEYPEKLTKLEKQYSGDPKRIWEFLTKNQKEYKQEIRFIKKQWYHRLYGEWIWIGGKPTWISPYHWMFLNWWKGDYQSIDRKTGKRVSRQYPDYRDRDRRKFIFINYAYTCTETFENVDDYGVAIPEKDGTYNMIDVGYRICFGINYAKHRRDGATQNCLSILYQVGSQIEEGYSSITANTPNTQKKHFDTKLVPAWRRMPFFFKPIHEGTDRPKRAINFISAANKQKDGELSFNMDGELNSVIDFAEMVDRAYYDHAKITGVLLGDEMGKTLAIDVYEGWNIIKPTMSQGGESTINPYALALHPSTVEEMEEGGGYNFKLICDASDFYQRKKNGQTQSGLFNMFIPAWDGLENFIGPYGESVIETPTLEQQKFIGRNYGAKEYIKQTKAQLLAENSPKSLKALAQFSRMHPECWADCWKMQGGDLGFNQEKLDKRMEELNRLMAERKDPRTRGNFVWVVGHEKLSAAQYRQRKLHLHHDPSHYVEWEDSEEGRFLISKKLTRGNASRRIWDSDMEYWMPEGEEPFVGCADPVGYHNKMQSKMREDKAKTSYAACGVFYDYDERIDGDKPIDEWASNRFVCSYMHKTQDLDEYCEESLMMCIYFNALMFPEGNRDGIIKYFEERDHGGYFKYAYEIENKSFRDKPGFDTGSGIGSKSNLFSCIRDYIEMHLFKEDHYEFIEQWKRIKAVEEMTKYDLFTVSAGCLLGQRFSFKEAPDFVNEEKRNGDINIHHWFGNPH